MAPLTPAAAGWSPELERLAERLAKRPWSESFYLAGSAGLSLYLDHREIRGLDLMSPTNDLTPARRRDLLMDLLSLDDGIRVETARDGFLYTRSGDGPGVKLFYYPYPLLEPTQRYRELAVASALDLGLMKLGAIISRGTRRDFLDLYLLCQRLPLEELLERSGEKFPHVRDFPLQALKGLADLSLTHGEPLPRLKRPVEWETVTGWLQTEVHRLGRRYVGLD